MDENYSTLATVEFSGARRGHASYQRYVPKEDAPAGPTRQRNEDMADITREELNAKLDNIQVRTDARVAGIESTINQFVARLDAERTIMNTRMEHIEQAVSDTGKGISGLRTTVVLTAISTILTVVLGMAAINATLLSNMLASFESGKNTAGAQAEVSRQAEATAQLLRQLQTDQSKTSK